MSELSSVWVVDSPFFPGQEDKSKLPRGCGFFERGRVEGKGRGGFSIVAVSVVGIVCGDVDWVFSEHWVCEGVTNRDLWT